MPLPENPVKTQISCFSWTDAIARGPEMTALRDGVRGKDKLDVPIKFIWNYAGNTIINQHSDINKTHEILQDESKCEMIVVIDNLVSEVRRYRVAGPDDRRAGRHYSKRLCRQHGLPDFPPARDRAEV